MCRDVPAASVTEPRSMRARCRRRGLHARVARGCVREKILENSYAFRNASSFAQARTRRRPRRRRRVGAVPKRVGGHRKKFAAGVGFRAATPDLREIAHHRRRPRNLSWMPRTMRADVRDDTERMPIAETKPAACAAGSECFGMRREGVSAPLPQAVRRSRRDRAAHSAARVPRPPPRTANRRHRRLR